MAIRRTISAGSSSEQRDKTNSGKQTGLKGPYSVQGKRYWFFVCIDDYSRYLLIAEHFDHAPTSIELAELLEALPHRPKKILTDNGPQFRDIWKRWCTRHHIEPVFAHP